MLNVNKYMVAKDLEEALQLKKQFPQARYLAGGTDILPLIRNGSGEFTCLIDLNRMSNRPDQVTIEKNALRLGGMVTHEMISTNAIIKQHFPTLAMACEQIGSKQIRTRGTLAGNLQNASPAADSAPPLVAAEAEIFYLTNEGIGEMPISEFYVGPGKTNLPGDAIITEIVIPLPESGWQGAYFKVGGREAMTIAIASAVILLSKETGYRVAFGSVSPTVVQARRTQAVLNSGLNSLDDLSQAIDEDICPINDVRATEKYRRLICSNFFEFFHEYSFELM